MSTTGAGAAASWLQRSGIRDSAGGVRRAYFAADARFAAPYPEVTAYAVRLDLRLWQRSGDAAALARARQSGAWLLDVQALHPGGSAFPYAVDGAPHGGWLTFDTALVGDALLELFLVTGEPAWLDAALRCARWVLGQQGANGGFGSGEDVTQLPSWAASGGCLHAKNALLFARLAKSTADPTWARAAARTLAWVGPLQRADGGFEAFAGAGWVFTHSHCYATEALVGAACELDDPSLVGRAVRAARFLVAIQRPGGAMPRYAGPGAVRYVAETGSRWARLRAQRAPSDIGATAQAVRLWTWLGAAVGDEFAAPVRRALRWLDGCRQQSPDVRIDGAFPAGVDEIAGWRRWERAFYPWVSVFVADAWLLQRGAPAPVF